MADLIKRDDAPEKIVAWGWGSPKTSGCYPHECHWMGAGYAHYIRADLADPAAIREAALREAAALCDRYPYVEGVKTAILALIGETK